MAAYVISTNAMKIGVLQKCGEVTDGTSAYDTNGMALDFLNRAHLAIRAGGNEFIPELAQPWPWSVSDPIIITLLPPITGTATATNGSTAVTLSSPPLDYLGANTSIQSWWININATSEWYNITTHNSGSTSVVLDGTYNDTGGSSLTYTVAKLNYDVSTTNGIMRFVSPLIVYRPQDQMGNQESKIYFDDETVLRRDFPMSSILQGTPTRFCITKNQPYGTPTLRFNKYVSSATRVEVSTVLYPVSLVDSTTDIPSLPNEFRMLMEYIASYWLCLDKNDDRAEKYLALAQAKGKAMITASAKEKANTSKTRGQIIPRQDSYWRGRRYINQDVS